MSSSSGYGTNVSTTPNENHPVLASEEFLRRSRIPELSYDDFIFEGHASDGGSGAVFRYTRRCDGFPVAMKFFGMKGCPSIPKQELIEKVDIINTFLVIIHIISF